MNMNTGGSSSSVAARYRQIERVAHVAEMQRALAALRDDPVALASACGVTLDPWQQRVAESSHRRVIMACSRQAGKSLVAAFVALRTALWTPGATILLLAAAERQSRELFAKTVELVGGLAATTHGALAVPLQNETQTALNFANGARVIALPATPRTIRGYSATVPIVDEAAHVEMDLFSGMQPALAVSDGRLLLLSSCYGARGYFYEAWQRAEVGEEDASGYRWLRVRVPATECPRISAEFLTEQRCAMPDWHFRSEYMAEFLKASRAAFDPEDIARAFSHNYPCWNLDNPESGELFIYYGNAGASAASAAAGGASAADDPWPAFGTEEVRPYRTPPPARPAALVPWERSVDPVFRWQDRQRQRRIW